MYFQVTINNFVHNLTGVNFTLYNITDIIGGLIFSAGMAVMYYSIIKMKRK